jgi:hypothetical protein
VSVLAHPKLAQSSVSLDRIFLVAIESEETLLLPIVLVIASDDGFFFSGQIGRTYQRIDLNRSAFLFSIGFFLSQEVVY